MDRLASSGYAPPRGFLLLDEKDNILICVGSVPSGALAEIDGALVTLPVAISLGHKIARFSLAAGDKVFRYGLPIGTMTASARPGDHIHQHNLASDYLPAHGRDAAQQGADQ